MKVGGALLAGYWPVDVPRRVAISQLPLPALVGRAAEAAGNAPALIAEGRTVGYGELAELLRRIAAALARFESKVVAIVDESEPDTLVLLLGALEAGCRVALVATTGQIRECGAEAVLAWSRPGPAEKERSLLRIGDAELPPAPPPKSRSARPVRPGQPAVMLPAEDGLVVHSHFSLVAMAMNLTRFVPALRSLAFIASRPMREWETLTGALGALLSGQPVVFDRPDGGRVDPARAYTILRREDADAIAASAVDAAGWGALRYVFVSLGRFEPKWRRRLEAALGRPVLPLWGSAEVGPAIAAHPTWYPLRAHGIALVNVTLVPIDPSTGLASGVPWSALNEAELGVDAPSTMVGHVGGDEVATGAIVRTSALVEVDALGVVTFLV